MTDKGKELVNLFNHAEWDRLGIEAQNLYERIGQEYRQLHNGVEEDTGELIGLENRIGAVMRAAGDLSNELARINRIINDHR